MGPGAAGRAGQGLVVSLPIGVGPGGEPPLPWLAGGLVAGAALQRAHALLVHGPEGVGQFELALALAQAALCEAPPQAARACGQCDSCRAVRTRSHPDLRVALPDALALALGWATEEDLRLKGDAKPSRELRVQQVRDAIDWGQTTPARGRAKALVIHPAEAMNHVAASALLKTLEEPPGRLRLLLCAGDPQHLLPTVRSRCQRLPLALPPREQALAWLQKQGLADAGVLLGAAGGSPLQALALAGEGVDAARLQALPARVATGDPAPLAGLAVARALDLLLKLAHDLGCAAVGAAPVYLGAVASLPAVPLPALQRWQASLLRAARHDQHPWNAGLLVEALVTEAAALWAAGGQRRPARGLHSSA